MGKLSKRDITKKLLADAAEDLNLVMKLDPPIPMGKGVLKEAIQNDVVDAAKQLNVDDVLKSKTAEVLTVLGVIVPVKEEKEGAQGEDKKESVADEGQKAVEKGVKKPQGGGKGKGKGEGKEQSKKEERKAKYTRSHALVESLKKGGSRQELAISANKIYIDNSGSDNASVAMALLRYVLPSLLILGVVEKTDQNIYQLMNV